MRTPPLQEPECHTEEGEEALMETQARKDREQMTSMVHASLEAMPPSGDIVIWGAATQVRGGAHTKLRRVAGCWFVVW